MPVRNGGSYRLQKDGKLRTLKGPTEVQKYGAHAEHPSTKKRAADTTEQPTSDAGQSTKVKESGNGE